MTNRHSKTEDQNAVEVGGLFDAASAASTPPETLRELGQHDNLAIRQAVARNASTPTNTLFQLWRDYPEAYFENPIHERWAEGKDLPGTWQTSSETVHTIYDFVYKREGVTGTHQLPEEWRVSLVTWASWQHKTSLFKRLAQDPAESVKIALFDRCSWRKENRLALAALPLSSFENLARDPSVAVRQKVASFSYTPPAVRMILAEDVESAVRGALAATPYGKRRIREMRPIWKKLANDADPEVRKNVCLHSQIDAEIVDTLSRDSNATVRAGAAASPSADQSTLERLSKDPESAVRAAVGGNRRTPPELLDRLARRRNLAVHEAILGNKATPPITIERVLRNCPKKAHWTLLERRKLDGDFMRRFRDLLSSELKITLAKRGGVDAGVLFELTADPDPGVRMALVERLQGSRFQQPTPNNQKLVDLLVGDPAPEVRKEIVDDCRVTPVHLLQLSRDQSSDVREAVAQRFWGTPDEALVTLCEDEEERVRYSAVDTILQRLRWQRVYRWYERYKDFYSRTRPALIKASSDSSVRIRALIAGADESPPAALDVLYGEADPEIRKTVRERTKFPYGAILDFALDRSWPRGLKTNRTASACTPSSTALDIMSKGKNRFLRLLTAKYCRTRISTLRRLVDDSDLMVREEAQTSLSKKVAKSA